MTIIETASMSVWLRASPSSLRASGSLTWRSSWRFVAPNDVPGLDRVDRHVADAQGGDPDGRRHGVDEGHDAGRGRAGPEEQHERGQVGVRRHDLHDVEDRREDRPDAGRLPAIQIPRGTPIRSDTTTAAMIAPSVSTLDSHRPRTPRAAIPAAALMASPRPLAT